MNAAGFLLLIFLNVSGYVGPYSVKGINHNYNFLGENKPSLEAYNIAMEGFNQIRGEYNLDEDRPYITIIDFTLPSYKKRLWLIDVSNNQIMYHTYVAHGRNTGDVAAEHFSNTPQSYQSSLGFYITGRTYQGKNGYSMYLEGLEEGINDKARERAIVMHGAWYVSEAMIKKFGRLGRSYGCPSVPVQIHKELIDTISDNTVLFIYHNNQDYRSKSKFF